MKKLKRTAAGLLLAGVMCVQALPMTAWAVDMTNSEAQLVQPAMLLRKASMMFCCLLATTN